MVKFQNQHGFVFEAGRFNLVGDFAECVFNESALKRRFKAVSPPAKHGLNRFELLALLSDDLFVRDFLG
jgi:hypothetical protein